MIEEGTLVVCLPEHQGCYEIDIRSHILKRILRTKQYEPDLVELVKKYIDCQRDVLDIGANIGLYSILFSKLINPERKVLAIEPAPIALKFLRRNIQRNAVSNVVIVFEGVATNIQGQYKLNIIPGMEEYSSLGEMTHPSIQGKSYSTIEVYGDTIDRLVQRYHLNPGFLKIDAEGAEYLVLSGAIKTLQQYKPVILSELSDQLLANFGHSSEKVLNLLQEAEYDVFDVENRATPIRFPFHGEVIAL